jgi:hypothetical protein
MKRIDEAQDQDARHHFREAHCDGVGRGAFREHLRRHQLHAGEAREQRQRHGQREDREGDAGHELQHPAAGLIGTRTGACVQDRQRGGERDPERGETLQRTAVVAQRDGCDQGADPHRAMQPEAEHRGEQQYEGQDS